jgi:hypothetical protein
MHLREVRFCSIGIMSPLLDHDGSVRLVRPHSVLAAVMARHLGSHAVVGPVSFLDDYGFCACGNGH